MHSLHPLFQSFADELVKLGVAKSVLTPKSSNVKGWSYDARRQQLTVTFRSGGTYRYSEVPSSVARALRRNKSAGKTIHKWVKTPGFSYEKLSGMKCKVCGAPATKGQVWADGRAIATHCDKGRCKAITLKKIGEKPIAERDLTKQASVNIIEGMAQKRRQIAKLAGAAKKQITFDGVTFKLEHLPGDVRSGVSKEGTKWERKMYDSYGYLPGTYGQGADGEAIDIYLAKDPVVGARVYKIAQQKKEGGFDEDKYMVGYGSAAAARKAYLRHMPKWALGSMTGMSMNAFRSLAKRKAS